MPVNCPHCGANFKNDARLATHLRKKHPDQPQETQPFACDECERSFCSTHGLHIHKVRTHGAPKKPPRTRTHPNPNRNGDNHQPQVVLPNFCPHCGMNLQLLAHALATIGDLQNG